MAKPIVLGDAEAEEPALVKCAFECIECMDPMSWWYYRDEKMEDDLEADAAHWVVEISPSPGELVGGAEDGATIFGLMHVDLTSILPYFSQEDPNFSIYYDPTDRRVGSIRIMDNDKSAVFYLGPTDNETAFTVDAGKGVRRTHLPAGDSDTAEGVSDAG